MRQVRFFSCRGISERRRWCRGIRVDGCLRELDLLCSNSNQPQRGKQFDPAKTHLWNVSFPPYKQHGVSRVPSPNIFHFLTHLALT